MSISMPCASTATARTPQGCAHHRIVEDALHLDGQALDIPLSEIYADIE